jgi:hypothetical protein
MARQPSQISGRWRIIEIAEFDEDYLNEEEQAFIRFDKGGRGEFHFGYVHGHMDCRSTLRDGKPAVEWSWDGNDEHHPAAGRGVAELRDDGTLTGKIFFHDGDDYGFRAEKRPDRIAKPKRKTKAVLPDREVHEAQDDCDE